MNSHKRWLVLILAIAFAFRAIAAFAVQQRMDAKSSPQQFLIPGDANGYWELAENILAGKGFTVHIPPRLAMRMPGFPLVLAAAIKLTGGNLLAIRLLFALAGTLVCGAVYVLGKMLLDERSGLIAAAITAIMPTMAGFSVLILSETLFALGLVCSLVAMCKLVSLLNDPDVSRSKLLQCGAGVGLACTLACYVRPSWLLAAPCFVSLLYLLKRAAGTVHLATLAVFAGLFLSLLPWAIRNQLAVGRPVLTTLWVGPSLYDGLNDSATGDSDMTFFKNDDLLQSMTEHEMDQHYRQKAWAFVAANPGRTIELGMAKIGRFWKPWPNAQQFKAWWMKAAVAATFLPLIVLAVIGGWQMRNQIWVLAFTLGPIIYFTAIHAVFVGSLRYRLPAEYPLCVLSSVGLQTVWGMRRNSIQTDA